MNFHKILILALFDLRQSIFKIKGLVFLIPYFFFWYLFLSALYENGAGKLATMESIAIMSFLFSQEIAQNLLVLHPPGLSVFYITALSTLPFFVILASNDQLAGDAGRQTFRFFLTRTTRMEIFIGRFISSYLLVCCSVFIAGLAATLISLLIDNKSVYETLNYGLHVILMILIYTIPFVAFMSSVSAMMSSALSSLLTGVILYISLIIIGIWINHYLSTEFTLVPSGIKNHLFLIKQDDFFWMLAGALAYTCVYGGIGWLIFKRRNI